MTKLTPYHVLKQKHPIDFFALHLFSIFVTKDYSSRIAIIVLFCFLGLLHIQHFLYSIAKDHVTFEETSPMKKSGDDLLY